MGQVGSTNDEKKSAPRQNRCIIPQAPTKVKGDLNRLSLVRPSEQVFDQRFWVPSRSSAPSEKSILAPQ